MEKQLNRKEVMALLGVSKNSLWRFMYLNGMPFFKVGKKVFFDPVKVKNWLNRYEQINDYHGGKKSA